MGYDMHWQRDRSEQGYFRANTWSMHTLLRAMEHARVLDFACRHPPWPHLAKLPSETGDAYEARAAKAELPVLTCSSPIPGRVPAFKFGSNDGWIVSAAECRIIADGLDTLLTRPIVGSADDVSFIREFAAYCRKCADANTGFEVW